MAVALSSFTSQFDIARTEALLKVSLLSYAFCFYTSKFTMPIVKLRQNTLFGLVIGTIASTISAQAKIFPIRPSVK